MLWDIRALLISQYQCFEGSWHLHVQDQTAWSWRYRHHITFHQELLAEWCTGPECLVCKLSLYLCRTLIFQTFPVWQQSWCLGMVRQSFCLLLPMQLYEVIRMTARKFIMYECFISCLGNHHEGVMILCLRGWAIMFHRTELSAGGWTPFVVGRKMLLAVVHLAPKTDERCLELVGAVPEEDNSLTWTTIAAEVRISTARVFCILLKQVGRRKVCAKWIPSILNEDQKIHMCDVG